MRCNGKKLINTPYNGALDISITSLNEPRLGQAIKIVIVTLNSVLICSSDQALEWTTQFA